MTAYFLQNMANFPMRLTLFEAADRLGGKIVTRNFPAIRHVMKRGRRTL